MSLAITFVAEAYRPFWNPLPVWEYTLGGYQVLKKWLSYREQALLGRPLAVDEVTYLRDVIRRIASLLLLGPELNANYAAVKAADQEIIAVAGKVVHDLKTRDCAAKPQHRINPRERPGRLRPPTTEPPQQR